MYSPAVAIPVSSIAGIAKRPFFSAIEANAIGNGEALEKRQHASKSWSLDLPWGSNGRGS